MYQIPFNRDKACIKASKHFQSIIYNIDLNDVLKLIKIDNFVIKI